MNTKFKVAVAVVAGAALGAAAVQGLHAQVKPKAYLVTESEVLDAAALAAFAPLGAAAVVAAGGRRLAPPVGKIVAIVGEAPKRIGITEWASVEEAQAYRNSAGFKNLSPQRDKATKTIRVYVKEGAAN